MIIDIYSTLSHFSKIKESLRLDKIVGVYGQPSDIRTLLNKACSELTEDAADFGEEVLYICLEYNHSNTELGYAYLSEKFDKDKALEIVISTYEKECI